MTTPVPETNAVGTADAPEPGPSWIAHCHLDTAYAPVWVTVKDDQESPRFSSGSAFASVTYGQACYLGG